MFILSIVLITLALVFYTIGVWSERIQGELKWWQVGAFALGFAADTSGTLLMSAIARSDGPSGLEGSPILAQVMAVSGVVDLVLMDLRFGRATHESKVMDGTDGVRAIRQNDGPPVLIVTTYGSDPEVLGALAAGAVGYVLKDSSTDELLTAIRAGVHGDRFLGTGVRGRMDSHDPSGSLALTSRELDVLRQVALGQTNAEIAEALFVSAATVKTDLNSTFDKLGVRSRTAAVARARTEGILEE